MELLLNKIRGVSKIDSTNLSVDQVRFRALRHLVREARRRTERKALQAQTQLEREEFSWEINPLLASIRSIGAEAIARGNKEYDERGVTEMDVSIQTMIHLAGDDVQDVWTGQPYIISDISNLIRLGDIRQARTLLESGLKEGDIRLNEERVREEATRQAQRLTDIMAGTSTTYRGITINLPAAYMNIHKAGPF